jgi:DNA-binding NtrC family response regulator
MSHAEGHRRLVLVADDDDDLRALIAETLRSEGYDVLEARDGAELLDLLHASIDSPEQRPELLISDVRMPVLSGLGVLSALRRAQVSMPVILITVVNDASIATVAARLGATGVLKKPLDMDELMAAVGNAREAHLRSSARFRVF